MCATCLCACPKSQRKVEHEVAEVCFLLLIWLFGTKQRELCDHSAKKTPYWVTEIVAKHVSMLLLVLETLCHVGVEPFSFTLSQLTDVQEAPHTPPSKPHLLQDDLKLNRRINIA